MNNSCFLPTIINQSSPSLDTGQEVFPILVYGSSHPHHLHVHELGESAERKVIDIFWFFIASIITTEWIWPLHKQIGIRITRNLVSLKASVGVRLERWEIGWNCQMLCIMHFSSIKFVSFTFLIQLSSLNLYLYLYCTYLLN